MNREKLEKDLRELQTEIQNIEGISPDNVERLEKMVEDLRAAVDTESSDAAASSPAAEDLRSNIDNFEIEHPNVTRILSRFTKLLSDMGI